MPIKDIFTFYPRIITPTRDLKGRAVQTVFAHLGDIVVESERIKNELRRLASAEMKQGDEREWELVGLFTEFERFILGSQPPVIKRSYTRDQLIEEIRRATPLEDLFPRLRLILSDELEKSALLFEIYVEPFITYLFNNLGVENLRHLLAGNQVFQPFETYITAYGIDFDGFNLDLARRRDRVRIDEIRNIFKNLYVALHNKILSSFGQSVLEKLIEKEYQSLRAHYDAFIVAGIFDILPEPILENERIAYLSKEELEEKVRERTNELRAEKENIEKKIEERTRELRSERSKLTIVAENMAEGAMLFDENLNVLFINEKARQIVDVGRSDKFLTGPIVKSFSEKFAGVDLAANYKKCLQQKTFDIPEMDVGNRIYKLSFARIIDQGDGVFFLVWIQDITEEKALERRRAEFVSLVTHQLRTPLSGVKWTLNLLINGDLGELKTKQRAYVMKANESNERMISLVDDILRANRIDPEKYRYNFTVINLLDLFDNILYEILPAADKKGIKIRIDRPNGEMAKVKVDSERMRAVIQNLLENAVKYTRGGGVIEVKIVEQTGKITASIKDNGIGIPMAQQGSIFKQFFRASNSSTVASGSGLGLFIAKSIIEKHNGSMWFESEENKGAAFFFSLPIASESSNIK